MRDSRSSQSKRRIQFSVAFAIFLAIAILFMKTRGELEAFGLVEAGILTVAFAGVALALWAWARSGRID
jgi:hypothetical protein